MERRKRYLIWGGKSQARILYQMIIESDVGEVACIFSPHGDSASFAFDKLWLDSVNSLKEYVPELDRFVVGVGGEFGHARNLISEALICLGLSPTSLVHARAFVDPSAELGLGAQIMPGAVVHKFSKVGKNVILNTNSSIDHECVVGDGVHLMGAASVAGRVHIGNCVTIGTNATILPDLVVGEGAFIGAGAVVTKSVEPFSIVTGVPARHVRYRRHELDWRTIEMLTTDSKFTG